MGETKHHLLEEAEVERLADLRRWLEALLGRPATDQELVEAEDKYELEMVFSDSA